MPLTATINGIEVGWLTATLDINKTTAGPHTGRVTIQSVSGAAVPIRDQEIIIYNGATRVFGGLVQGVPVRGSTGDEPTPYVNYETEFIDFSSYADRQFVVNGGFVEGTSLVSTALPALMGHLSPYGVTLDTSGIPGGVLLPHLPYDVRSIRSILDEIGAIVTGGPLAWGIDYSKVLSMYVPGTVAAPFNITDGENADGDIWSEPANTDPANYIIGRLGSGTREIIDTFTGDGSTTAFPINYFPLIAHRGIVNQGGTVVSGVIVGGFYETFSIGGGGTWDYDPTTGIITRSSALANGVEAHFQYTAQFPITVIADGAVSPVKQHVVDFLDIFDRATGQLAVNSVLNGMMDDPLLVHYRTRVHGLEPGMFQSVSSSKRGISIVGYIQEINMRHVEGDNYIYDVTVLEGFGLQNTWRDIYKEWSDIGGGGSTVSPATVTPPTGGGAPGLPLNSVQFNRSGTFGGDAGFTYDETTDCIISGVGNTITAANPSACQVFGTNNHIVDP